MHDKPTKLIFVTGGVVSSIGKGLAAASMGTLMENRGLKITVMKLDPYINVDPGTMSPFQHGEVYVTGTGPEGSALYRCKDTTEDGMLDRVKAIVKFKGSAGEHGAHGSQEHGPVKGGAGRADVENQPVVQDQGRP